MPTNINLSNFHKTQNIVNIINGQDEASPTFMSTIYNGNSLQKKKQGHDISLQNSMHNTIDHITPGIVNRGEIH